MQKFITILLPLQLLAAIPLYSQGCCTAGTSVSSGAERGVLAEKNLSAAISFQHNNLSSTYQSTTEIQDPLNRSSEVNIFNLEVEYGLADKVSLLVILPYSNKSRETTITNSVTNLKEKISLSGNGLGDIIVLGKYEVISPNILSPFGFAIGGGAKLPTGSFENENNGTRLSIDLQPGTGSSDLLLWGNLSYGFPLLGLSFNASVLYKYSGFNSDSYRIGDEILVSINSSYSIAEFLGTNLQIKGRAADRDYWNSRFLPSTGGTYFDITPALIYYEGDFSIRVFAQFPIYRNLQGIQLAISEMPGAEIRYNLDLN